MTPLIHRYCITFPLIVRCNILLNLLKKMIISGFTDLRHILDFLIGLLISLQQSAIFLKHNPTKAHLTIDQLNKMANANDSYTFMSKLSRYVSNISGSPSYWNKIREDLKAIISQKGAPTIFIFSPSQQQTCIGLSSIHYFI